MKPEEKLIGYIRKDDEPKAFRWLDENGYGGMIKSEIRVAFNRDQIEQAKELQNDLRKQYPGVTSKASIHWKTLSKWVEERMKEGKDVPAVISFDKKYQTKIKPSK